MGLGKVLQDALNHCVTYGTVSSITRIHRPKKQRAEMGMDPLTISPFASLTNGLRVCWTGGPSYKGRDVSNTRHNSDSTELPDVELLPSHFGQFVPLN